MSVFLSFMLIWTSLALTALSVVFSVLSYYNVGGFEVENVTALVQNWSSSPYLDTDCSESSIYPQWRGLEEGCQCLTGFTRGVCKFESEKNCRYIEEIGKKPIITWKERKLCNSGKTYFSLDIREECDSTDCGVIDDLGNKLCVSSQTECPPSMVVEYRLSTGTICKDKSQTGESHHFHPLEPESNWQKCTETDHSYSLEDTWSTLDLYKANKIFSYYNTQIQGNTNLFSRKYIGIHPICKESVKLPSIDYLAVSSLSSYFTQLTLYASSVNLFVSVTFLYLVTPEQDRTKMKLVLVLIASALNIAVIAVSLVLYSKLAKMSEGLLIFDSFDCCNPTCLSQMRAYNHGIHSSQGQVMIVTFSQAIIVAANCILLALKQNLSSYRQAKA